MHQRHPLNATATACALLIAGLFVTGAQAQGSDDPYTYFGVGVGQARARFDFGDVASRSLGIDARGSIRADERRDTGYKVFGGYQFNRYLGLEAGYFRLGSFSYTTAPNPASQLDGRLRVEGLNLDLVGSLPLGEGWSALGRVGAQNARTRNSLAGQFNGGAFSSLASERRSDVKYGLGLQYDMDRAFAIRAEAERFRIGDARGGRSHINMISVSLVLPIGRASQSTYRAAAPAYTPAAYVAPAPAPEPAPVVAMAAPPAPVVAPLPPSRKRVSFSSEQLFGFDRAELREPARAALDGFVQSMQGTLYESITVEGHTDRLGTEAYNQTLSQQRAETVKAYLVEQAGVDSSRIRAVGRGEASPLTRAQDCKGQRPSPALIACLAPDRRVDIEVVGNR